MQTFIDKIIKLFFTDLGFFAAALLLIFLIFFIVQTIQNGKNHLLTNNNIFLYSLKTFPGFLGKHLKNILSLAFIIFLIHIFYSLFNSFVEYMKSIGTYDKVPVLAFFIDAIEAIIPVFKPFVIPALVIIAIIVFGYGLFATLNQLYKDQLQHEKTIKIIDSIEEKNILLEDGTDSNQLKQNKKIQYKPSVKELFFYFCENSQKSFFAIAKFLPKIIIVLAVCIGINSVFLSIKNITTIVDNQKRINELHLTVKNLSNSEALARITLLKEEKTGTNTYPLKTYKIEILTPEGDIIPSQTQNITLRGEQIFIDAMNINFEYSEISLGEKYNIAYPYRVYSETMAPTNGIPLACMYEDGKTYPVIYSLSSSNIYGMKENVFFTRLAEIFDIIKDENLSREMGIRSVIGVANHFTMKENEVRDIFIEGTGGISVKKHESLFSENEITDEYDGTPDVSSK